MLSTIANGLQMEPTKPEPEEDPDDVRMSSEQVNELGSALSILSAKSSVLQEREDLRKLVEGNLQTEASDSAEDSVTAGLAKRVRSMITKIDKQLEECALPHHYAACSADSFHRRC